MKITDVTPDAVRLGRHPADAVRSAQQVRGLERARASAHRHRRWRRGPRLPGLGLELGGDRRAGPDHASQAHADGPQSAAPRGAGRRSVEAPARRPACAPSAPSTWRCGIFWARRSASRSIACSAPIANRCRPMPAPPSWRRPARTPRRPCEFKENGWAAYKIHPPTRWREDIKVCEAVRNAVGDYTIMLDSTWAYDYPGGGARRPRRRGDGLPLVRGPARRPGHLQLREAEAAALDPDHGHRVPDHRPRFLPALDHAAGHRLPARRRRREGRHHHPGEGRAPRRSRSA